MTISRRPVFILSGFLLALANLPLFSQEVVLPVEQERKAVHGVGFRLDPGTPVVSIFDKSEVVKISEDPEDGRNFGAYVEVRLELSYSFKGVEKVDVLHVVYSNLSKVSVTVGQVIDKKTILGLSGGKGTTIYGDNSDVFLYLYTKEPSPYLKLQTKNRCLEEDGVYWWSPLFLFGK